MSDFTIKQGDTLPVFAYTIVTDAGVPVNLTGATVNFVLRQLTSNQASTNAVATVVSAPAGNVSYTFTAADSAVTGTYMGTFNVTFSGGGVQQFPTTGYLEIIVEENLTTLGGAQIIALGDVKEYLNIDAHVRSHDNKLIAFINGARPIVENIVGHIIQQQFDEWYDGGQTFIRLRHRPVLSVQAATEYRGPIAYNLMAVQDPAHGSIYSYMLDGDRLVRRSPGGSIIATPYMPQSVHVVYTAGRTVIPPNIWLGILELIRENYQETQQIAPHPGMDFNDTLTDQPAPGMFVPPRVRELLMPHRRAPSVA